MKKNKKLLSILSIVCAFIIIFSGVFAFFSDSTLLNESTKVGKVDINVEGGLYHSDSLNNLNPGDNDIDVPTDSHPGTDHELSFKIDNLGNKSIIYRTIIEVSGTKNDSTVLTEVELMNVILSEKKNVIELTTSNNISSSDTDKYETVCPLEPQGYTNEKLVYIIGGSTENDMTYVLNGIGDNAETENGITATNTIQTFDIGLDKDVTEEDLQGATLTFNVIVQAMQYRNTGDEEWNNIFEKTYTTEGIPETNRDDLAPNSLWYKAARPRSVIETISFIPNYIPNGTELESWNADADNTGDIKVYILNDGKTLVFAGNNSRTIKANKDSSYMFSDINKQNHFTSLKEINGLEYLDTKKTTNMNHMFYFCPNIKTIDLSNLNISKVTDMSYMFNQCYSLTTLNVSGLDTSNVIDMNSMFFNCTSLTSLDLSNFNTSKTINMSNMFNMCPSLRDLNISSFNTSNVTDMSYMFYYCPFLTTLDLNNFNTSKVTNMAYMFYLTPNVTTLNVSNFDTSNVTDMSYMFYNCSALTSLDVSNFDTSKVTNMAYMFYTCPYITDLDVSNFDTSNVTDMSYMFHNNVEATVLDVSNFNTAKVTNMSYMFYNCRKLIELDLSNFNTQNVTNMQDMFKDCLVLQKVTLGTNFAFKTENSYLPIPNIANIDNATGKWYNSIGEEFDPEEIPNNTADIYIAFP